MLWGHVPVMEPCKQSTQIPAWLSVMLADLLVPSHVWLLQVLKILSSVPQSHCPRTSGPLWVVATMLAWTSNSSTMAESSVAQRWFRMRDAQVRRSALHPWHRPVYLLRGLGQVTFLLSQPPHQSGERNGKCLHFLGRLNTVIWIECLPPGLVCK